MSSQRVDSGDLAVDGDSRPATATAARPSDDVRKRMDDIFVEMELQEKSGRLRLPSKFAAFYKSDVMFLFVRAVVGYTVAFVKALELEKELRHATRHRQLSADQDLPVPCPAGGDLVEDCRQRLGGSMELRSRCAVKMAAAYSRLVLHCSNFENHKEDERFFECIYLFACSVAKLSVSADPAHWRHIEEELGFLFRGAQFSSTVKAHARAGPPAPAAPTAPTASPSNGGASSGSTSDGLDGRLPANGWTAPGAGRRSLGVGGSAAGGGNPSGAQTASPASATSSSMALARIQSLSPAAGGPVVTRSDGGSAGGSSRSGVASAVDTFELPKSRVSSFPESVPVKKIVSDLEATKSRAARNMEIAQTIRDQIATQRAGEHRRRVNTMVSPRQLERVDELLPILAAPPPPSAPSCSPSTPRRALVSPRISMKSTFVTRSPALNHLLPTTEERVRMALEGYERELQERRQELRAARRPPPSAATRWASPESAGGGRRRREPPPSRSQSA